MTKDEALLKSHYNFMLSPEKHLMLLKVPEELLAQPEQNEYIKMKKEQEIYFVKDEFGTLRPTFKNPKETPFWIDVLHGRG